MSFDKLPSELQAIKQEGFLDHAIQEPLKAKLGFRQVATREDFPNKVGETVTKTRPGLRAPVTSPITPAAQTDLNSGLTPADTGVEQFTLSVDMYGASADTNLVTEGVAITSKFLLDARNLMEQAGRSVDMLARNALFGAYMGGESFTASNAGSDATVAVDNVSGFKAGDVVTIDGDAHTIASVAVDGSNTSSVATLGGKSGVITFTANVTCSAGDLITSAHAAKTIYGGVATKASELDSDDYLTADMILNAKAELEADNVPMIGGFYNLYIDGRQARRLYNDQMFRDFQKGRADSDEYRDGVIAEMLGVRLIRTNMNGAINGVHRSILVGKGALVEGVYTNNGYANANRVNHDMVTLVQDIAHIIREPQDRWQQWVSQSWCYIGGFVAPTDALTDSSVLPSASSRRLKRAIVLASR